MTDPSSPPAGPAACSAIANTMIGHFATRLEVEARRAGGSLDAEAIRALAERFMAEEGLRFAPALQRSWDACTQSREAAQWQSSRAHPFDRLLTKPFAHLFPARRGDDGGQGVLSRRLLPGFHLAVDKMIGPALFEQCQRKAQAILDRHRRADGSIPWDAVHADAEAHALSGDVLAVDGATGNFASKNASATPGTVNITGITLTGTDAGNYTLGSGAHATSTAVITPRSLTGVTGITAADKVYDRTTAAALSTGSASFGRMASSSGCGAPTTL